MAKSTVASIITKIKRRIDYDITDTDLENLLTDIINDSLKILHQWFLDYGMPVNNSASATLTTTASQAYVDISSSLASMDEILCVSERTNDTTLEMIPYSEFVNYYPDPTANTSNVPRHAAVYNERLYLGPTPSAAISLYVDYTTIPTEVTSASTLPFKTKYDPLLIALVSEWWIRWYDKNNRTAINTAAELVLRLKQELIVSAVKNPDMNRQAKSRVADAEFGPRIPSEGSGYGYGVGGYGGGGYGG